MKYYFVVGERSGDLHASNLIKSLKKSDVNAQIRGMGGELMKQQEAVIFKDYNEVAYMGFLEVFINIRKILQKMKEVKKDILSFKPDVIVLVDFAGFNMKIAAFAKEHGIKVFYYISPKIWAWNQKRAFKIKKLVDKMFVILPFEKEFYKKFNYQVDFVGNPVYDSVRSHRPSSDLKKELANERPIIALLPGSRKQEVINMLSTMRELPVYFPNHLFVIAGVSNLPKELYEEYSSENNIKIIFDKTYDLLSVADLAVVTSGTATLETALFGVPQVVVYKTSAISYFLAKSLIKIGYISLVNLIADKQVVKELIQNDFNSLNIKMELEKIIRDENYCATMIQNYNNLKKELGDQSASEQTAKLIVQYLK